MLATSIQKYINNSNSKEKKPQWWQDVPFHLWYSKLRNHIPMLFQVAVAFISVFLNEFTKATVRGYFFPSQGYLQVTTLQ